MVIFLKIVVSALILSFFGKKSENFERWKIRKFDEEKVFFFRGKNVFIF